MEEHGHTMDSVFTLQGNAARQHRRQRRQAMRTRLCGEISADLIFLFLFCLTKKEKKKKRTLK
jgi:hypothetical protein